MVPNILKTKGSSLTSTGCPTFEDAEDPGQPLTPPSSPLGLLEQSYSIPLRRSVNSPDKKVSTDHIMSGCSSEAHSTPPSPPTTGGSMNTVSRKIRPRRSTPSSLDLYSSQRRVMLWFCYAWITVLYIAYMDLTFRYRDQIMKEVKSPTIIPVEPLLRQVEVQPGENGNKSLNSLLTMNESLKELDALGERTTPQRNNISDRKLQPRVVFLLSPNNMTDHQDIRKKPFQNEMGVLKPPPSDKVIRRKNQNKPDCVPKADWHSYNFMNCNSFHEISFASSLAENRGTSLKYMFRGGTRETWLFENSLEEEQSRRVIFKTLRYLKDYDEIRFDRQRVDALASERLTGSPYVVQTHGYCGMSTINEFADGGHFGRYFAGSHANLTSNELLVYARDAALGLADVHEIADTDGIPTLVHHDLSPKNLLLTADNRVKISDFNDAQLLYWNFRKNKRCDRFSWDGLCGTTVERTNRRSPEECDGSKRYGTTERTEVYHLGTIFHFMLSREQFPYQFEKRGLNGTLYEAEPEKVKKMILNGEQPPLPADVEESTDPAIQAIVRAMRKALTHNAAKRPSAREIANLLQYRTSTNVLQT